MVKRIKVQVSENPVLFPFRTIPERIQSATNPKILPRSGARPFTVTDLKCVMLAMAANRRAGDIRD